MSLVYDSHMFKIHIVCNDIIDQKYVKFCSLCEFFILFYFILYILFYVNSSLILFIYTQTHKEMKKKKKKKTLVKAGPTYQN